MEELRRYAADLNENLHLFLFNQFHAHLVDWEGLEFNEIRFVIPVYMLAPCQIQDRRDPPSNLVLK